MPFDDAEEATLANDRDRLDRRREGRVPCRYDGARRHCSIEQRTAAAGGVRADDVVEHLRRTGVRAHLVGRDESTSVPGRQPQDEISEGEVGPQGPRLDEGAQVIDISLGQIGALARDVVKPGHGDTVVPNPVDDDAA